MSPSATFVALQRLADRRRGEAPGAPGGPAPAPASQTRVLSSASETRDVSLEEADFLDEPERLAAVTARALSHLPRFEDVVSRYRLFRGDDADAKTGNRCSPVMEADGEMTCRCRDCARWREVVAGEKGEPPFWATDTHGGTGKEPHTHAHTGEGVTKPVATVGHGPMYEVFTREHVAGLAEYFRARAADVIGAGAARSRSLRVLELGAGSGALHRALAAATRALDAHAGSPRRAKTCSVTYHATDDYSFLARRPRMVSDAAANEKQSVVARLDYRDALRAPRGACDGHPPDVVLICWHPIREDWTADVRRVPSVCEYVLVGETDFGACGRPAETWGMRDVLLRADDGDAAASTEWQPPHEADGVERVDLAFLSKHQVCRTDEPWLKARRSKTVSFRRRREAPRA